MTILFAFLFMFFSSYCNADDGNVTTHTDPTFVDDDYTHYQQIAKLDDTNIYGSKAVLDFYLVLIFGLFTLQMNLLGSLYIIYRTYLQWRRGGKTDVPLSLRFPFYIALTDAFLSIGYTVNLSYTLIYKLPWPNPACRIIGASVITLFTLNTFLVGIIAVTTWCYVCKEYYIEFGSYDYKLWAALVTLSAAIMGLSINKTGQQKYWCAGRHHSSFIPIVLNIFILLILGAILFCYIRVLLKIRNNDENLFTPNHQRARIEKRALRKLISYIFIFLLQFIPLIAYNFFNMAEVESVLLHVLAITTINFGGIGNFVQFVINEGFLHSAKQNSQTTPTSSIIKEQPENSVPPKEIEMIITRKIEIHTSDVIDNQTNNLDKATPNLTSEEPKDVILSNSSLEDEKPNRNIIEINIEDVDDDESLIFYDTPTPTVMASVNSSDALLNNDDDFLQELDDYTNHGSID